MLDPQVGQTLVDGTVGLGGHARLLRERIGADGQLICFDWDARHLVVARERLAEFANIRFVHASYDRIAAELGEQRVDGILLDIGICNAHLQAAERGFAWRQLDAPLDCRMRDDATTTAAEILNSRGEQQLADIFYNLGEIRSSRRLAAAIVRTRRRNPLAVSRDLLSLIQSEFGGNIREGDEWSSVTKKIAAQAWQALRITVNGELDALQAALPAAAAQLAVGGTLAVISFHSLEDRIIKNYFRTLARGSDGAYELLTKKPLRPSAAEVAANPKSRSAKLRGLRRVE